MSLARNALPLAVLLLPCLVAPSPATAVTVAELTTVAQQLKADIQDLQDRADACPDGECEDAAAIRSDFDGLEVARAQLHADRATLDPGCGCSALDDLIDDLDVLAATLGGTIAGWDETAAGGEPATRAETPSCWEPKARPGSRHSDVTLT